MISKKLPMTETALILPIALFIGLLITQMILTDRLTCAISSHILNDRRALIMSLDLSPDSPVQSLADHIYELTSPLGITVDSPKNITVTDKNGNTAGDYSASADIFSSLHTCRITYRLSLPQTDSTFGNDVSITAYYDLTDIPYDIYFLIRISFIINIIVTFAMLIIFGIRTARIAADIRESPDGSITVKDTLIRICSESEFCTTVIREATRLKRHGGYLSIVAARIADLDKVSRIHDRNIADMIEQSVIRSIADNIRIFDIVGRFADDERIYICMIDSNECDSYNAAARFVTAVRDTKFFIDGHEEICIDINCGVAATRIDRDDPAMPAVTFGETDCRRLTANASDALLYAESQTAHCIALYSDLP